MAVRIRLSRIGKKKEPFFRLVAVDSRSKRDGQYLANIGTYDAINSTIVSFNEGVYDEWVAKGALPTDSAKKIYRLYKRASKKAEVVKDVSKAKPQRAKTKETATKKEPAIQKEKAAVKKEDASSKE